MGSRGVSGRGENTRGTHTWLAGRGWFLGLLVLGLAACAPTLPMPSPGSRAPQRDLPTGLGTQPTARPPAPQSAGHLKVGLLLPLSGRGADIGTAMLDAAQLALFDVGGDRMVLVPRDTQGTVSGAREGVQELVGERVQLVLGPLFRANVGPVKPIAAAARLNVIAFTNDWRLAGGSVFIMGFTPGEQARRITAYALSRGLRRIGVLAPRSPYGEAVVAAVRAVAAAQGGTVTAVERYATGDGTLSVAVQRVVESALSGVGFDALMLAEGGNRLRRAAAQLAAAGLTSERVRLLGTGLWDDPALADAAALVGGWYAAPNPSSRRQFESRYRAVYGMTPPRLSTLAYDATALAAVLVRSAVGAMPVTQAALTDPNGFSGVDGLFRLNPDGRVERGLTILEVTRFGPRVIDVAPGSFDGFVERPDRQVQVSHRSAGMSGDRSVPGVMSQTVDSQRVGSEWLETR